MKNFLKHLLIIASFIVTQSALATTINLYEQPKADSKIIATIDSNAGIMPIYTPKGDWIKVADPRNGNVGWIKSSDLKNVGFSFNIIRNENGKTQGYQVIQYGNAEPYTPEQVSQIMKKMQVQQQAIQNEMQKMIQDMSNINQQWVNIPMVVPVLVVPEKAPAISTKK